jgi:acetylornithine deacetylase/succinyl-diaminopimelate desuccinylase-like protein
MAAESTSLREWLEQRTASSEFREYLAETLLELCRVDTVPTRNIADTASRERELLSMIEERIARHGLSGRLEGISISPDIAGHPFYTFPHYAGTADAYRDRRNLLYLWDGPADPESTCVKGGGVAVNSHIDTVDPYLPPRREGSWLYGRGACDDKSGCTVMIAALRLLGEIERRFRVSPASDLTFMFVIEEEMGGNGSLSLALDEQLGERYGTMVVLECCDGLVHPGGRGAIWYRVEIPAFHGREPQALQGYNPLLLALEIIRTMDRQGAVIQAQSDHPLFPRSAVQTSPGILGAYGEHPARICASVAFELSAQNAGEKLEQLDRCLKAGLREYFRRYGDKSRDRSTGGLHGHYGLHPNKAGAVELRVQGLSGHMGALYENDNALIKAAYMLGAVDFATPRRSEGWTIRLLEQPQRSSLVLEGGQGFVPTHSMERIKTLLGSAVHRAYRRYARSTWRRMPYFRDATPRLSFAKLHNEAFQSDPAAPAVAHALSAAADAGIGLSHPVRGWEVSSDARIFAHLRPGISVFTTGPGSLALAHSDQERISIEELARGTLMLTLFLLRHGGLAGGDVDADPADS